MKIEIDEHSFFYWIRTVEGFLVESFHLCIQVFSWAVVDATELNKEEFHFRAKELGLE